MLTEREIELILSQCKLQRAESPRQIAGLSVAWQEAKFFNEYEDEETFEEFIMELAILIEPRNKNHRIVNVSFGPGKPLALAPDKIKRAMENLTEAFWDRTLEPDELYKEFEEIHPFEDGNGRLGEIIWRLAKVKKGEGWPDTHPPNYWGER